MSWILGFRVVFGFILMIVMRYQMVHAGTISPDTYNSFGAMHGTIMVFLGIVPVIVGGKTSTQQRV